jgi:hypothetical protein
VIRGETGFTVSGSEPQSDQLLEDEQGIWLHNFLWAGTNPGGLIESYWYEKAHIYSLRPNGEVIFDHRPQYRTLYNFLKDIPLNNGSYQDAQAVSSNPLLRVMGQKDLTHQRAHLWIQNIEHTWKNVVDGRSITLASGIVRVDGFQPGEEYRLEWWNTYEPDPERQMLREEMLIAASDGSLQIQISNLADDLAVRIKPMQAPPGVSFQLFLPAVVTPSQN